MIAGRGGDDEAAPAPETDGTTGSEGLVEGASYDITAEEFIAELQPDKQGDPEGVGGWTRRGASSIKVDAGFVLLVTAAGERRRPDASRFRRRRGAVRLGVPQGTGRYDDYVDAEGNVSTLRESLSPGSIRKISKARHGARPRSTTGAGAPSCSSSGSWWRWEIAGLPIDDQKRLLARYRMADSETRAMGSPDLASTSTADLELAE